MLLCAIGCLFREMALLIDSLISRVPNKIKSATHPSLGLVFCKIKCFIYVFYLGRKNGPNNDQWFSSSEDLLILRYKDCMSLLLLLRGL